MSIMRVISAFALVLAVFGGANFYVARRIYGWLNTFLQHINIKIYIGAYIFLVLITLLGLARSFLPMPMTVKNMLSGIGSYWLVEYNI